MSGRVLPDLTYTPPAYLSPAPRRPKVSAEAVRELHAAGFTIGACASQLGCSRATVIKYGAEARLEWPRGRRDGERSAGTGSHSRHEPRPLVDRAGGPLLPVSHPALSEARSLYPSTVKDVPGLQNVLVSGANAWKIGREVTKGKWRGFPIFTLTLEERATCPTSCTHWRSCYGNHMQWAHRVRQGPELEQRLELELALLQSRYPRGFAVRLHVLGDFYSAAYVAAWRTFLERFPALRVFGFSARWDVADPIGRALVDLALEHWDRFAMRFSNAPVDECSTVSIEHPLQKPADAVICPQQLGLTEACATCALCWHSRRRIAFLRH